ncbi:MAG: hypothetical protein ACJAZS_000230 [Alteromonas naphthalenivorans]|jgi:hypothetical protein
MKLKKILLVTLILGTATTSWSMKGEAATGDHFTDAVLGRKSGQDSVAAEQHEQTEEDSTESGKGTAQTTGDSDLDKATNTRKQPVARPRTAESLARGNAAPKFEENVNTSADLSTKAITSENNTAIDELLAPEMKRTTNLSMPELKNKWKDEQGKSFKYKNKPKTRIERFNDWRNEKANGLKDGAKKWGGKALEGARDLGRSARDGVNRAAKNVVDNMHRSDSENAANYAEDTSLSDKERLRYAQKAFNSAKGLDNYSDIHARMNKVTNDLSENPEDNDRWHRGDNEPQEPRSWKDRATGLRDSAIGHMQDFSNSVNDSFSKSSLGRTLNKIDAERYARAANKKGPLNEEIRRGHIKRAREFARNLKPADQESINNRMDTVEDNIDRSKEQPFGI